MPTASHQTRLLREAGLLESRRLGRYCHNYQGGYVLGGSWQRHGYLYAGNNWFVCQARGGENPAVGSARNNWWLYTQADVGYSNGGWGWFPATKVSCGGNYQAWTAGAGSPAPAPAAQGQEHR